MGCQAQPTKVIEESVDVFADRTVLVDTRDAFLYQSFHISGSVNLNSSEFIVLKNPKTKKRIFDPDLAQTIERLARRGISPDRHVILISERADDIENKKWRWLLNGLEIEDVTLISMDDFKKKFKMKSYAEAARQEPWVLKMSENLQKELILKKAQSCFVNWSEKNCRSL